MILGLSSDFRIWQIIMYWHERRQFKGCCLVYVVLLILQLERVSWHTRVGIAEGNKLLKIVLENFSILWAYHISAAGVSPRSNSGIMMPCCFFPPAALTISAWINLIYIILVSVNSCCLVLLLLKDVKKDKGGSYGKFEDIRPTAELSEMIKTICDANPRSFIAGSWRKIMTIMVDSYVEKTTQLFSFYIS